MSQIFQHCLKLSSVVWTREQWQKTEAGLPSTSSWGQHEAHLEADVSLLTAEASQHEEDEGEEAREGDGNDCYRGRPRQLAQGSPVCNKGGQRQRGWAPTANSKVMQEIETKNNSLYRHRLFFGFFTVSLMEEICLVIGIFSRFSVISKAFLGKRALKQVSCKDLKPQKLCWPNTKENNVFKKEKFHKLYKVWLIQFAAT